MRVTTDCLTCNRIIISAGRHYPPVNGRISRINPKNREFAYEVILEDETGVYVRPEHVIEVLPCPIHTPREEDIKAIAKWLQKC